MVQVGLWGTLKSATEGRDAVEVEASNIKEMLERLGDEYPGLKPQLDRGVSVSVDGKIYNDAWFHPLSSDSEVYLLPRLRGG